MFGLRKLISGLARRDAGPARDGEPAPGGIPGNPVGARFAEGGAGAPTVGGAVAEGIATAPDAAVARASALRAAGRLREAHACIAAVAIPDGARADLWREVARIAFQAGDYPRAEHAFRRVLATAGGDPDAQVGRAAALHAQDRTEAAEVAYREVLATNPAHFDALIGLGNCLLDCNQFDAAEAMFRAAIAVDETRAVGWTFLARALDQRGAATEAIAAHRRAVALGEAADEGLDPGLALAGSLRDADQLEEALATFERHLRAESPTPAFLAYSHTLLAAGRLREGWAYMEFRRFGQGGPAFGRPVWNGQDLSGKRILLQAEQGLGDTIQFIRYAPHVQALGATVFLLVPPALALLARRFAGIDRIIVDGVDRTAPDFDFHAPLMSLPRLFGTTLDTIPGAARYLDAEPDRVARWAPRTASGDALAVGLAWGGNPQHLGDRHRSMPLHTLAPLAAVPNVRFFSLQKGPRGAEAASPPPGMRLEVLGPELVDMCDAAAVIANLDLVICVDTALAHLAGALGKPVWLLIARPPDWRWQVDGSDTPWYPSARLFRQRERGRWDEVVAQVADALRVRAETRGAAPAGGAPVLRGETVALIAPAVAPVVPARLEAQSAIAAVADTWMGVVRLVPGDERAAVVDYCGEWLQPELELLAGWLGAGMQVLITGAAEGLHAIALSRIVGPAGHVFVYEQRAAHRLVVEQNLAADGVANATVLRCALGGAAVDGRFDTVDGLQLRRLDLLKVDDAGYAGDVLAGAMRALSTLRPMLSVRVRDEAELVALVRTLQAAGYRCWRQFTPYFRPANFSRRSADLFAGRGSLTLIALPEERAAGAAMPLAQPIG